jgi:hypothetical protein
MEAKQERARVSNAETHVDDSTECTCGHRSNFDSFASVDGVDK